MGGRRPSIGRSCSRAERRSSRRLRAHFRAEMRRLRGMCLRAAFLLVALALAACDRTQPAPAPAPAASGLRIVPTTTAAAELLTLDAGPEDVLALPEQVDSWSAQDFAHGGWEKLPRFAHYVAEPLLVLRPSLIVNHDWQAAETTKILAAGGIRVLTLGSGTSYPDLCASITKL